MNGFFSKTIFGFVGFVLLFSLVFYSFFIENMSTTEQLEGIDFKKGESTHSLSGITVLENKLDIYNTVYSTESDYKVDEKNEILEISIGEGKYLFDFKKPFNKILIKGSIYEVVLEEGGMIYVENSAKDSTVVSLNTIANLNIINKDTQKKNIELFLYPHMYLGFNLERFEVRKDLDSLRVSQLGKLGYFSDSFDEMLQKKSMKFTKQSDFFLHVLTLLKEKQKKDYGLLKEYQSIEVKGFPGLSYIEQYFSLFYNKSKKVHYYKNNILEKIIQLLSQNKKDFVLVDSIYEELQKIKEIDPVEYNDMVQVISDFYFLTFSYLEENGSFVNFNYYTLSSKIFNANQKQTDSFIQDFDRLNFLGGKSLYTKLLNTYDKGDFGEKSSLKYDYYLFFIKNVILLGFDDISLDATYFHSLVELFYKYSQNLKSITFLSDIEARTITNILYNEEIMKSVLNSLGKRYFKEGVSEGLLIPNDVSFKGNEILEKAIDNTVGFYSKGKTYLLSNTSKYTDLISNYEWLGEEFNKKFLALTNYSLYKKNNSELNKKLLGAKVFSDISNGKLTTGKFYRYISKFNGVNISGINLETIDDTYYRINNITIKGRVFSFEMYPYRGNRITNINAHGVTFEKNSKEDLFYEELKNTRYDLEEEEESYERVSTGDDETYNFENFFLNKFFPSTSENIDIYVSDDGRDNFVEDDEIIRVFKTAKLLGDKGEFRKLKGFLDIKYTDLEVEKIGGDFSIHIEDSKISTRLKEGTQITQFFAFIRTDYILEGTDHYFENIEIRPFRLSQDGEMEFVFGEEYLSISGTIDLSSFKNEMDRILNDNNTIRTELLKNNYKLSEVSYDYNSKKLILSKKILIK